MRRSLILTTTVVAFGVLSACSPAEIAMWERWHDEEPKKAEQWVEDGCDQLCTETVTIGEGDSVSMWAERRHVGVEELAACSGLSHLSEMIHPGDELTVPPSPDCAAAELPEPEPPAETPEPVQDDEEDVWEPEVASEPDPTPEAAPAVSSGSVWDSVAECESGGDWSISTGNGYYGGLQFSHSSWQAVGGSGYPHHHSREEQIARAERLLDEQGWGAWPSCASQLGLR